MFAIQVIGWVMLGMVVGVVAKLLMPPLKLRGFLIVIALGVGGAVLGGYIGRVIGINQQGEAINVLVSIAGSIGVIILYRVIARGEHPTVR